MTQRHDGTLVRLFEAGGYGFIRADGDTVDIFLHRSRLRGVWPPALGSRVCFDVEMTTRGRRAVRAEIIPRGSSGDGDRPGAIRAQN